ncbi:MAG: VWA domain-containing protein [Epsilonproteobacteria bacterium]|nr:MAG: VWA domain-containing protein [Campylobacterota bacterium]
MTLLSPSFLWLMLPLFLLLWKGRLLFTQRIHLIVLMLLVLTLSRPVEEQALQEASIKAKDILIAIDVSYSMKATDIAPTRYDFAKETIALLLEENPGDNVMLIAFTTNPLLLSPPTTDHKLITIALESLNPEFILTKGTSLEKLFQQLAKMNRGHKNLILMTDGGEEDNLEKLTKLLHEADVSLTVLALGTTQGTTVHNSEGTLLKDQEGNLVVSRINPLLASLVSSVSGTYIEPYLSAAATAREISRSLQSNARKAQNVQKMQRYYLERYQIPLFLAALLFLMVHTRAIKYLFLLFALLGFQTQASVLDNYTLSLAYKSYQKGDFNTTLMQIKQIKVRSLQSQMTLGHAYYRQGDFKKAIHTYKSIRSTSVLIKQQLYYNIANAYAMQEAYDKAKIYYTRTLQLGEDVDARYNLSLIALLRDPKSAQLGIAHPKSQSSNSSKSEAQEAKKDETRSEDQPSSGSGGGGESQSSKEQKKSKLLYDGKSEQQPLSSKVYELINKGYIHEKQPW